MELTLPTPQGSLTLAVEAVWAQPEAAWEGVVHRLAFAGLDWGQGLTLGLLLAEGLEGGPGSPYAAE